MKKNKWWSWKDHVLIGLSGGVDSIVLTHLINTLPEKLRPRLSIAHVNHQLREESEVEEEYIRSLATDLKLPLYVYRWDKESHPPSNTEAAARRMRYDFFEEIMKEQNLSILLTGHHLSDQAETVLMKLTRGGIIEDKTGIQPVSDFRGKKLIRPLLPWPKEKIYHYAKQNSLFYFEDETNASDRYLRNRIRRRILPLLKEENPLVEQHLSEFSKELSDLLEFSLPLIEKKKKAFFENRVLNAAELMEEEDFIQRLVIKEVFKEVFLDQKSFHKNYIDWFLDWLKTSGPNSFLELKNGIYAQRSYREVRFGRKRYPETGQEQIKLGLNEWVKLPDGKRIGIFKEADQTLQENDLIFPVLLENIELPVTVRHRKEGDRMSLKGRSGTKKIKDIFIDLKVPAAERDAAWIVEDAKGQIIWLVGYKESQLFNKMITDKMNYVFIFRQ